MLPRLPDVATFLCVVLASLPNAFTHALARERGVSERRLHDLVAAGALERLGHGLYRRSDAPPVDVDRVELALRAPEATLCLTTALAHHDLTDAIPSAIDVALPRSRRQPRVSAPVRWHRFQADTFHLGRTTIDVDGELRLGVYSAQRSIIDAFRLRHQEGEDVAIEALRRWLKRAGAAPTSLLELARHFPKAEPALLNALRILS
jgi:predicted transcriptional regulator of viral defense system